MCSIEAPEGLTKLQVHALMQQTKPEGITPARDLVRYPHR